MYKKIFNQKATFQKIISIILVTSFSSISILPIGCSKNPTEPESNPTEEVKESNTDNDGIVTFNSKILNGNITVQVKDENNNSLKDINVLLALNDSSAVLIASDKSGNYLPALYLSQPSNIIAKCATSTFEPGLITIGAISAGAFIVISLAAYTASQIIWYTSPLLVEAAIKALSALGTVTYSYITTPSGLITQIQNLLGDETIVFLLFDNEFRLAAFNYGSKILDELKKDIEDEYGPSDLEWYIKKISLLPGILILTPPAKAGTEIFKDDFESYNNGAYPSANGWYNKYSGVEAKVSNEKAYSGTKSFKLIGRPYWARTDMVNIPKSTKIRYEFKAYIPSPANSYPSVGIHNPGLSTWGHMFPTIRFDRGIWKVFSYGVPDERVEIANWSPDQWYHVEVTADFTSKKANIKINGVFVKENLTLNDYSNYTSFYVSTGGFNEPGNSTLYVDDIIIYNLE